MPHPLLDSTEVTASVAGNVRFSVLLASAGETQPRILEVPFETGLDLVAQAFSTLARTPGIDRKFAQHFGSVEAIEHMRRFVASYDEWKEQGTAK